MTEQQQRPSSPQEEDLEYIRLPDNFRPAPSAVICGRGRGYYSCPGNVTFREIVQRNVPHYLSQKTKSAKTAVLRDIVEQTKYQNGPNSTPVKFVKQMGCGEWYELSDLTARDKVGNAMREAISAHNKAQREVNNAAVVAAFAPSSSAPPVMTKTSSSRRSTTPPSSKKTATSRSSKRSSYVRQEREQDTRIRSMNTMSSTDMMMVEPILSSSLHMEMPSSSSSNYHRNSSMLSSSQASRNHHHASNHVFGRKVELLSTSQEFFGDHSLMSLSTAFTESMLETASDDAFNWNMEGGSTEFFTKNAMTASASSY